jgi:hypothetical protein
MTRGRWYPCGPGYPRIVNGTIDRGAFEVQNTAGPAGGRSILATAPHPETATLAIAPPAPAEVSGGQPLAIQAAVAAPTAAGKAAAPLPPAGRLAAVVADADADPLRPGW